ncbi:MAG: TlpA family protein disulfide reductase [Phycisphaerales bacterium]|nr:TlpA family protein disulfide reductase [Phycisphaerales bacterium]
MNLIAMIVASTGLAFGVAAGPDKCPLCADHEKTAEVAAGALAPTPTVDPAEYAKADWPKHNSGDSLYAKDFQGQQLPVALGKETWLSEQVKTEGKVIVLDFWATWCPPCRAASPILDKLQKDHKDDLAVLAIGGQREDIDTVRSYMGEHEVSYSHLFDAEQSVFTPFESEGIPLVVVISTDGVVRWIGNPHDKNFKKAVAQTLKVDPLVNAS